MNAYRYRSMCTLAMQPLTYADKDQSYPRLPKSRFLAIRVRLRRSLIVRTRSPFIGVDLGIRK